MFGAGSVQVNQRRHGLGGGGVGVGVGGGGGGDGEDEEDNERVPLLGASKTTCDGGTTGSSSSSSKLAPQKIEAWVTNVYDPQSIAIALSYFCVGIAANLPITPVMYYLVESLDSSGAVVTVYQALSALPFSFKVFYGFWSDCVPIMGQRRKPYFVIGWSTYIVCYICLAMMGKPTEAAVILFSFIACCGYMMSDVMTDSLVVQRTKMEPLETRGTVQASAYIARGCGAFIGNVGGSVLYNKDSWGWGLNIGQIFFVTGIMPLVLVMPFTARLVENKEKHDNSVDHFRKHVHEIWTLVQKRAVWEPMTFIYIYNVLMIPNAAWTNFLIDGLGMNDFSVGVVAMGGSAAAWLGLVLYKRYFNDADWQSIYIWTTAIIAILSVLQLVLIFGWNKAIGLPNLLFATGDDAAVEFLVAIQFLPLAQMYATLCPEGAMASSYAMLTTLNNVAYAVAFAIGEAMTSLFDVSNESLREGHFGGMWKLTLLTSVIQICPLVLVRLLPADRQAQNKLRNNSSSSKLGGTIFVAVTLGSILFSLVDSLWYVIAAA